jgi:hypothetical protein
MPICIKCDNNTFEIVEHSPRGSNFRFNFIQCSQCGGVVGVVDYFNIGQLIHDFAAKLGFKL